jgi:SAM-dependent methyltransferase
VTDNQQSSPGWPDDEAVRLHTVLMGYLSSAAVFSAVDLGVFDALEKPGTAEELAQRLGLPERSMRQLLLALLGVRLVVRDGDVYHNTAVGSRYLVSTSPDNVHPLVSHQAGHFAKFAQLTKVLRENTPIPSEMDGNYPKFGGPVRLAAVSRTSGILMMVEGLVKNARLGGGRRLVDLGCGSGIYSMALAREYPDLHITAVETPWFAELVKNSVAEAGLDGQITVQPGDIFEDTFDGDVAMLSNVAEGYGPQKAQALLRNIHRWLPAGGELLFHSHMWEPATTPFPYSIGLILMVNNTMGGETHGAGTTTRWLYEAGFSRVEPAVAVSPISGLIRAYK